jgi:hypothetical protein
MFARRIIGGEIALGEAACVYVSASIMRRRRLCGARLPEVAALAM